MSSPLNPVDRHWFYERAIQSPAQLLPFLQRIHGGQPLRLREDFCARARLCDAWLQAVPGSSAVGIDWDADLIAASAPHPRKQLFAADLRAPHPRHVPADLIFVGNFSISELATRCELTEYFRRVRAQAAPRAVLVVDTYGGPAAWRTGSMLRIHALEDGRRIHHIWEQRAVDPITHRVENALHFRLEDRGEIVAECTEAFLYRWRLWGLADLIEAGEQAGWLAPEVYPELEGGPARPEGESWAACVAWRCPDSPRTDEERLAAAPP